MKKTVRNVILFDDNEVRKHLMPFTYTITTISEKWQAMLGEASYSYLTVPYLKKKFPLHVRRTTNLMVAGHVIPTPELAQQVLSLQEGEALMVGEELIAFNGTAHDYDAHHYSRVHYPANLPLIVKHLYDIFEFNGMVLKQDFDRLTAGRESQPLSATNTVIGDPSLIFIEEGAYVEGAMLNTHEGPIYIGKNVEVMGESVPRSMVQPLWVRTAKLAARSRIRSSSATAIRPMRDSWAMPLLVSGATLAEERPPAT